MNRLHKSCDTPLWSKERHEELQARLSGIWSENVWPLRDLPIWGVDPSKAPPRATIDFTCTSPMLNAELKYACWQKCIRHEWVSAHVHKHQRVFLAHICAWLNVVAPQGQSLLEQKVEYWMTSFRSYLAEKGMKVNFSCVRADASHQDRYYTFEAPPVATLRWLYFVIEDYYDTRPEFEKDCWSLDVLNKEQVPGHGVHSLEFRLIPQPWLRSVAKQAAWEQLADRAPGTVLNRLHAWTDFARFLDRFYPDLHPTQLTRKVTEAYLRELPKHKPGAAHRRTMIGAVRGWLLMAGKKGWEGVPNEELIFTTDYPKRSPCVPRFIPEPVVQKLREHADGLSTVLRRMFLIFFSCGMRISEVLGLQTNCLVGPDSDGDWFLFYFQWKMDKEHTFPLIVSQSEEHRRVVQEIQAQIQEVTAKWGTTCTYLFPNSRGKPWCLSFFNRNINQLCLDKDIRDPATNQIFYLQSHQFRHTLGYKLINSGTPQAVVQRLFGHESATMTQVYTHLADETAKKALGDYQRKVVNIRGEFLDGDARVQTTDLQWFKKHVRGQAVLIGGCGLPIFFKRCPHANSCLTCAHWRISMEDLPAIKNLLEREERVQALAKAMRINDAIEVGEELIATLKTIITALETTGSTQPTLLENASPKEVTLNALKQTLITAEVELAQARAQGNVQLIKSAEEKIARAKAHIARWESKSNGA